MTYIMVRVCLGKSLALGVFHPSFHCILNDELKFHPYKIMVVQQMCEGDFIRRKKFCERMIDILEDDPNSVIVMSDEAHFHLNGYVNKQNFRYWATANLRELHERPLHSPKVTVWCGVTSAEVVGPLLF